MTKHIARRVHVLIAACALIAVFSREASAYIDPASGSYILQMLIAGVVGAGFAVKIFWKNIMAFFTSRFSRKNKTDGDDA